MKVTMKDIANKLGISINAVSIALNDKPGVSDEMRLEILKMADKMGYINQKRQYLSVYSKIKYLYFNAKLLCRYRTLLFDCFTVNR